MVGSMRAHTRGETPSGCDPLHAQPCACLSAQQPREGTSTWAFSATEKYLYDWLQPLFVFLVLASLAACTAGYCSHHIASGRCLPLHGAPLTVDAFLCGAAGPIAIKVLAQLAACGGQVRPRCGAGCNF